MKSHLLSTKRNRLILGAAVVLCLLGGGLLWQQRQARIATSPLPVYMKVQTPQGVTYKQIPESEWGQSSKQLATASTPRYWKVQTRKGDEYIQVFTPEGQMHSLKSYEYRVKRNFPAAVDEARKAVRADPNNLQRQVELGLILQRAGQREEAMSVLRKVAPEEDSAGKTAAKALRKIEQNPTWGQPKR